MHEFPPAEALNFLVGLTIGQIALDPYSLQFRFQDGGQITVEGKIEHVLESGEIYPLDCQKPKDGSIYLERFSVDLIR